ncbi:MAG: N-acetylmuramoyl-L-alanine amidase [Candidatus Omnitrophica bacterium]|nr:N-acetylmuramoyl-L-alanine amidase [Candidatus Omnitrophota bacterium]MDE2223187.1 N-acetylmuramoyl-L-alanine amidase [Candidatus Omnitrophota bacterium]
MIARLLTLMALIMVISGCAVRTTVAPTMPMGIPLADLCERYHVNWQWDPITQEIIMEYRGNKSKALVGSSTVLIGKRPITLSAPVRRANSTIYVPDDFETKVLAPFGLPIAGLPSIESSSRVHTVVIDAGHGGKDRGTMSPYKDMDEKEIVLDVARRLKPLLEDAGIKVIMTRDTDDFISLPERTIIAAKSGADLFVSIHVNSNENRRVKGLLVYYLDKVRQRDLSEDQRKENAYIYLKSLKAENSPVLQSIVTDMMDTVKTVQTRQLARDIVKAARSEPGVFVRGNGMRLCHFYVVRNTLIPAVLIETGFLSNRQDHNKLVSSFYRQKLAEVIARGILDYANE